jgi:hypothetical protein
MKYSYLETRSHSINTSFIKVAKVNLTGVKVATFKLFDILQQKYANFHKNISKLDEKFPFSLFKA